MAEEDWGAAFASAVQSGDAQAVRRIAAEWQGLRDIIDEARFAFAAPALVFAAGQRNRALVDALLDAGADPDARSEWDAGPYSALHSCVDGPSPESLALARHLVERGATLDLHAAAGLDRTDIVEACLDVEAARVNEPGPDGAAPLHLAASPTMVALLVARGADLEQRCVDHRSTPIMWSVDGRASVTRALLEAGARPDLFIAAFLDEPALVDTIVAADPDAIDVTVRPGRSHSHLGGGDKYVWALDFADTPHEVARRRGHASTYDALIEHSRPPRRLVAASRRGDVDEVARIIRAHPELATALDAFDAREALLGDATAAAVLLDAGMDPDRLDHGGSTALHHAAWRGEIDLVGTLLAHGARTDIVDATHQSTPIGWADYNGKAEVVRMLRDHARP